jgi:hypothetical protein
VVSELDVYTKSEPGAVATGPVRVFQSLLDEKTMIIGKDLRLAPTRSLRLPVLTSSDYQFNSSTVADLNTFGSTLSFESYGFSGFSGGKSFSSISSIIFNSAPNFW